MLITPPHIGRLSNHPLLMINLYVVCLTHTLHMRAPRRCNISHSFSFHNSWKNIICPNEWKKKRKEMRSSFFFCRRKKKKKVVITSKAFSDLKINQTTQWRRQCCLFYKDLWHTYPHPQTESTPLLYHSTQGFTYCTLRHAYTLIRRGGSCMLYARWW